MARLFLAHLSDLHFTSTTPADSARLLRSLTSTLKLIRGTRMTAADQYRVVVTGDLTDHGAAEEFALAQTFLRSKLLLGRHPVLDSLCVGDEPLTNNELGIVPGNHDHWNGKWWILAPSQNPNIIGPQFRKTPWRKIWRPDATTEFELEIFGLDTSSGMEPKDAANFFQGGRISDSEFEKLQNQIDNSPPRGDGVQRRVRSILIHHSLCYAGGRKDQTFDAGLADVLHDDSRTKLLEFAVENRIHALLSGHTHDFWIEPVSGTRGSRVVHELRSAATLKGDLRRGEPGFLLHQLAWEPEQHCVKWTVWKFRWTDLGFRARTHVGDYQFCV
jgi:3',5'-cyclic AMP phosphodiesterase CpdA